MKKKIAAGIVLIALIAAVAWPGPESPMSGGVLSGDPLEVMSHGLLGDEDASASAPHLRGILLWAFWTEDEE